MWEVCNVPKDKAICWPQTRDDFYEYEKNMGLVGDELAYPPGYVMTFYKIDKPKGREFAAQFSGVYARKATGKLRIMVDWEKGPAPDRVFHSAEWPIIKEGLASGRITEAIQVNPKNHTETRIYDPTIYGLT